MVTISGDTVNVTFSKELLENNVVKNFISYITYKKLASRGNISDEEIVKLTTEIYSDFWNKNKLRFHK